MPEDKDVEKIVKRLDAIEGAFEQFNDRLEALEQALEEHEEDNQESLARLDATLDIRNEYYLNYNSEEEYW